MITVLCICRDLLLKCGNTGFLKWQTNLSETIPIVGAWVLNPATSQEDLGTSTDGSRCLQQFESIRPPATSEGQCRKHPGRLEEVPPNAMGEELITAILNSDNQTHKALTIWKPRPPLNSLNIIQNN